MIRLTAAATLWVLWYMLLNPFTSTASPTKAPPSRKLILTPNALFEPVAETMINADYVPVTKTIDFTDYGLLVDHIRIVTQYKPTFCKIFTGIAKKNPSTSARLNTACKSMQPWFLSPQPLTSP